MVVRDPNPFDGFRTYDKKAREEFHKQPAEKKEKSLKAKTFILYPFELKFNQDKSFEQKEEETMELVVNHLKAFKKPFVATSFGMDSMVLMHIVMRASKIAGVPVPEMWLNDTLNTFKEEKQYWSEMVKLWGIEDKFRLFKPPTDENGNMYTVWSIAKKYKHLPHFRYMGGQRNNPNKPKSETLEANAGATPKCCDILKKATLKAYLKSLPEEERYDCHFIGTRAEESRMRAMSVLQRCRTYLIRKRFPYPIRAVTPLSYWKKEDIDQYYEKYNIPKNPTYEAHNIPRMGCASCPAHKNWETRLAKDPTVEGFGMLKMNLKILQETQPKRFQDSIEVLEKFLKKKNNPDLPTKNRDKLIALLNGFNNEKSLENFF